jgi:hypothetical protein
MYGMAAAYCGTKKGASARALALARLTFKGRAGTNIERDEFGR